MWVQDYQLQLVPAMLRELRPDLRIGFFLHIPFPPTELFMQLPVARGDHPRPARRGPGRLPPARRRAELPVAGPPARRPGAQPRRGRRADPARCRAGRRPHGAGRRVPDLDRRRRPGHDRPAAARCVQRGQSRSGPTSATRSKIILGVDRLDYTKGIDVRLYALQELLAEGRLDPADVAMVQLATPSRERVEHYQRMRGEIEQVVGRINGEFGRVGRPVVHYLHQSIDRKELAAFFSRRGRHARDPGPRRHEPGLQGVRRLPARPGRRAGAQRVRRRRGRADQRVPGQPARPGRCQERHAVRRWTIDPAEGRRRMRALRRQVLTHDVDRWARSFLDALQPAARSRSPDISPATRHRTSVDGRYSSALPPCASLNDERSRHTTPYAESRTSVIVEPLRTSTRWP